MQGIQVSERLLHALLNAPVSDGEEVALNRYWLEVVPHRVYKPRLATIAECLPQHLETTRTSVRVRLGEGATHRLNLNLFVPEELGVVNVVQRPKFISRLLQFGQ